MQRQLINAKFKDALNFCPTLDLMKSDQGLKKPNQKPTPTWHPYLSLPEYTLSSNSLIFRNKAKEKLRTEQGNILLPNSYIIIASEVMPFKREKKTF